MLVVINGKIISDEGILEGKCLIIEEGKILGIQEDIPPCSKLLDAGGNFVAPGFIDIHIHGAGGYDTMDGSYNSINEISKIIARRGVTSFYPTTMTTGPELIKQSLKAVRETMDRGTEGAQVLGAHLEGPFINKNMKGAQDEKYVMEPDIDLFMSFVNDDLSIVKRVTMAPEVSGTQDFIRFLVGHGIVVSAGHTSGTYDEIMDGIGHGISHSTHLYNAMRGFSHREPGVVGAVFDSRITSEFIADGIHIHFAAIRTALAVKGYENIALITDAIEAACMADGVYSLGGQQVFVREGAARLKDGTLAGSTLTMDAAVKNVLKNTNLNIQEAVYMASSVPAKIMRVNESKGYLLPGYDADITIFDSDINIKTTIAGGKVL